MKKQKLLQENARWIGIVDNLERENEALRQELNDSQKRLGNVAELLGNTTKPEKIITISVSVNIAAEDENEGDSHLTLDVPYSVFHIGEYESPVTLIDLIEEAKLDYIEANSTHWNGCED